MPRMSRVGVQLWRCGTVSAGVFAPKPRNAAHLKAKLIKREGHKTKQKINRSTVTRADDYARDSCEAVDGRLTESTRLTYFKLLETCVETAVICQSAYVMSFAPSESRHHLVPPTSQSIRLRHLYSCKLDGLATCFFMRTFRQKWKFGKKS